MNIYESFLCNLPIAHRGLHESVPENSFPAFSLCIQEGYAIETDVRFSKDGKVIIFHDDELKRLTGKDGKVIEYTFKELKKLHLGNNKEQIPSLEEFLSFIDGKVPILIEIKNIPERSGIVEATLKCLENYQGEYAFQSFNPLYVKRLKELAPNIFRGQLASKARKEDFTFFPKHWRVKAWAIRTMPFNILSKPNFISYSVRDLPYRRAKRKGIPLLAWVVRTTEDYEKIKNLADNIIFEEIRPKKEI